MRQSIQIFGCPPWAFGGNKLTIGSDISKAIYSFSLYTLQPHHSALCITYLFTNDKILDLSKLKALADKTIKCN